MPADPKKATQDMPRQDIRKAPQIPADLPEELELTEHEWYEYHYHLPRNRFLLRGILALPGPPKRLYLLEPFPSYLDRILEKAGFEVRCDRIYPSPFQPLPWKEDSIGLPPPQAGGYDVLLLLNALENQDGHPQAFLEGKLTLLRPGGFLFLLAENLSQFRNRLKILLGHSVFTAAEELGMFHYRALGLSDLNFIASNLGLETLERRFIAPYPPFRMEPLTLRRYLLKYLNYLVMRWVPGFRNLIFLKARKPQSR